MFFSRNDLDDLAISLREEKNRYTVTQKTIEEVFQFFLSIIPCETVSQYELGSLSLKVLANYVADVSENANFVFNLVENILPIAPAENPGSQQTNTAIETEAINFFIQVQWILLSNLVTTLKSTIPKSYEDHLFDDLLNFVLICESRCLETDFYLVLEILEDIQPQLGKFEIAKFLILRDLCKLIKENAEAEGDEELQTSAMKVCLKYSLNLDSSKLTTSEKESLFFKLYSELESTVDEQILLNVSFEFQICTLSFFENLIGLFFNKDTGELKIEKHIPISLLLLSNEIVSEDLMNRFVSEVSLAGLVRTYFHNVYPQLSFKSPWELQSIALLNKIPIANIIIDSTSLRNYTTTLTKLINTTTLQISMGVVALQLTFLGKILASNNLEMKQKKDIVQFLDDFKLSNDYKNFGNEFKQLLNQTYFPFLCNHKDQHDSNEFVKTMLEKTINESKELLDLCIRDKTPVQMTYLIELSKIFGFYAEDFKQCDWFIAGFCTFQKVFSDVNDQMNKMSTPEQNAWRLLENNIKFTSAIISEHSR